MGKAKLPVSPCMYVNSSDNKSSLLNFFLHITQMHPSDMRAAQSLVSILSPRVRLCALRSSGCWMLHHFLLSFLVASACFCVAVPLQIVPVSGPADKGPERVPESSVVPIQAAPKAGPPKVLQGAIPSGHIPKPVILPDYIAYVSLKMNCRTES